MPLPQPIIQPVPDSGRLAAVVERFLIPLPICGKTLEVLPSFLFDGTSIPREAWTLVGVTPFDPDFLASALAHDGLVRAELLTPAQRDAEFSALLKLNSKRAREMSPLFFAVVRAAAQDVLKQHTPESIAQARRFCSIL